MVQPSPFPAAPPPPAALTTGVMILLGKARIRVLKARAMTSPTAITINSPCIRKLRNPLSIVTPPAPVADRYGPPTGCPCDGTILERRNAAREARSGITASPATPRVRHRCTDGLRTDPLAHRCFRI